MEKTKKRLIGSIFGRVNEINYVSLKIVFRIFQDIISAFAYFHPQSLMISFPLNSAQSVPFTEQAQSKHFKLWGNNKRSFATDTNKLKKSPLAAYYTPKS